MWLVDFIPCPVRGNYYQVRTITDLWKIEEYKRYKANLLVLPTQNESLSRYIIII